ncbi:hypothetical protein IU469_30940 [Nocardia puris]|uniref:Uncharacterized protein n=1 Tax=Nocardia puris TaxID=208602 RepID=A0A366CUH9_9NOCA|nr:hypothetical protein [Nocardia puris]MBF6215910.1 hypothetical protein [Nocardia puris]MBF6370091.1 hypothetical protein [Nocardia puris]RBO79936.1 hypothetical protein DFR74_12912 [Nocardia puris]
MTDPSAALVRFRRLVTELDNLADEHHANPANDSDSAATADYIDNRLQLLESAVEAATDLDAAASRGRLPTPWTRHLPADRTRPRR